MMMIMRDDRRFVFLKYFEAKFQRPDEGSIPAMMRSALMVGRDLYGHTCVRLFACMTDGGVRLFGGIRARSQLWMLASSITF